MRQVTWQVGGDVKEALQQYKRREVRQKWEELESLSEAAEM